VYKIHEPKENIPECLSTELAAYSKLKKLDENPVLKFSRPKISAIGWI